MMTEFNIINVVPSISTNNELKLNKLKYYFRYKLVEEMFENNRDVV